MHDAAEIPTVAESRASDATAKAAEALEALAQAYGRHSGPASTLDEREAFARDLHAGAMRYARAYYAEARELGLIPAPNAVVGRTMTSHPADCATQIVLEILQNARQYPELRQALETLDQREIELVWRQIAETHLAKCMR